MAGPQVGAKAGTERQARHGVWELAGSAEGLSGPGEVEAPPGGEGQGFGSSLVFHLCGAGQRRWGDKERQTGSPSLGIPCLRERQGPCPGVFSISIVNVGDRGPMESLCTDLVKLPGGPAGASATEGEVEPGVFPFLLREWNRPARAGRPSPKFPGLLNVLVNLLIRCFWAQL